MLSLHYCVMFPLFVITLKGVNCQQLTAVKDEESSLEGSTVTLSCKYTKGAASYFFWYRQHPGKAPEFLISHSESGDIGVNPVPGLSVTVRKEETKMDLKISSVAVTDSAVYYCALTTSGGYKLIFGSGTRLTVEPKEEYDPYYYKLQEGDTTVCLATGFSRYNATSDHEDYGKLFNDTEAARISPDLSLYNQVIFPKDKNDKLENCEASGTESGPCEDTLTPDPTVNGMSLTILALRVIFLKTVVCNILMTMRLWISQ